MESKDLDDIIEIENSSFPTPWPRQAFEEELLNPLALYLCIEYENKVVAYMGVWKVCDEGHITNVAVLPKYRGLGFSKLLMTEMFDVLCENGITRVTLEVRESNSIAISLYEKLGFVNCGKRPKYYYNPVEDAIIMWKELDNGGANYA